MTTSDARRVEIKQGVLLKNDRVADENRRRFAEREITALNLLSSPGSGKTALLEATFRAWRPNTNAAVIVGDLATENDARRLRAAGAPAVQVNTGRTCHLDAQMVANALLQVAWDDLRLLFIENVGNLVCPASYDLGESLRVVLLSVTEGEDKPLKYPGIFLTSHVVVITKIDLAAAVDFDRDAAVNNIRAIAPEARIVELSARTGEGMRDWLALLETAAKHVLAR